MTIWFYLFPHSSNGAACKTINAGRRSHFLVDFSHEWLEIPEVKLPGDHGIKLFFSEMVTQELVIGLLIKQAQL